MLDLHTFAVGSVGGAVALWIGRVFLRVFSRDRLAMQADSLERELLATLIKERDDARIAEKVACEERNAAVQEVGALKKEVEMLRQQVASLQTQVETMTLQLTRLTDSAAYLSCFPNPPSPQAPEV